MHCQHRQRVILREHGAKTRQLCSIPLKAAHSLPIIFVNNKVALRVGHVDLIIVP
jgi:hypothetical protein